MSEHKTTITVATIGLVSAISVAVISNWNTIFPNENSNIDEKSDPQTEEMFVKPKPKKLDICEIYDLDHTVTCNDFYDQRKNKTIEYIRQCGYHQINQYKTALHIKSNSEWVDFIAPCK